MTCADGHAELVEQRAHIEWVNAVDHEAHHGVVGTCGQRGTEDAEVWDGRKLLNAMAEELLLVGLDAVEALHYCANRRYDCRAAH